jgi:hypothetical protein
MRRDRDADVRRRQALHAFASVAFVSTGPAMALSPSGGVEVRRYERLEFSAVRHELPGVLHLRPGRSAVLVIRAEPAVVAALRIGVQDGELRLSAGGIQTRRPIEIDVDYLRLQRLTVAASGDAVLESLTGDALDLVSSGSGHLVAKGLNLSRLTLDSEGSGDVSLQGEANASRLRLQGSGALDARALTVRRAELLSLGSGDAVVRVVQRLDVTLDGSGDVRCIGRPAVTRRGGGSGDVRLEG